MGRRSRDCRKIRRVENNWISPVFFLLTAGIVVAWLSCRLPENAGSARNDGRDCERDVPICREAKAHLEEPLFKHGEGVASQEEAASATVDEERLVEAFCRETDRWVRSESVSVDDVQRFVRKFSALPQTRKNACLHRALNLIPDANVMLLAGILFDPSQPKAIVKEVFDDVVNRSDEVKDPILKAVCQDRSHPCCDDARWIFEVTGEVPK